MSKVSLGTSREVHVPQYGLDYYRHDDTKWYVKASQGLPGLLQPLVGRPPIVAEGWIDVEEVDLLEYYAAGTVIPNVPSHIGLYVTSPTADAGTGGTEATGGSYARDPLARNGTNWGNTSAGAPSTIENLIAITFVQATANWGTITSWAYFDAVSAGNLLLWAVLDTAKAIDNGDTADIAIGDAVIQLGDPGDSY